VAVAACPALIDFSSDFIGLRSWLKVNGHPDPRILKSKRPAFVIQDQADAKEAVLKGLGIAVLPERLVRDGLERGMLVEVLRRQSPSKLALRLLCRSGGRRSSLLTGTSDFYVRQKNLVG